MKFIKKPIILIVVAAVLGLSIGAYALIASKSNIFSGLGSKNGSDVTTVQKTTLTEEVRASGKVKAAKDVTLAFERGGKVVVVNAKVGSEVRVGQTLAVLENADLAAQRQQAEANVKAEQSKLDELKRGTRVEDIDTQRTSINNAMTALEDAKLNLVDKLLDTYTKADDAIHSKADQMFENPQSNNPKLVLFVPDTQLITDLNLARQQMNLTLNDWKSSQDTLTSSSDFAPYIAESKRNLGEVKSFLDKLSLAISDPNSCSIDISGKCQPTSSTWKSDVSSARTNINAAISSVTSAESGVNTAKSNLVLANQGLVTKQAGTAPEQISAQEARIESAMASIKGINAQIGKTILRSPIDGVVTARNIEVGEIAPSNSPIITISSASKFEIEISVSESDIGKVKVGNPAKVTLDAYGNEAFEASVVSVDPAETVIGGINTYKITLQFAKEDERIKSGLTANVSIETAKRENVLAIPERLVISRNEEKFVLVANDNSAPEERKIETGIRGSNGFLEVLSGLQEGDRLVSFGAAQ